MTTSASSPKPDVLRCTIAAHGVVRAAADELAQWRRQPPPLTGQPIPASFLKHSEDQTVAAVAAVYQAILQQSWLGRSFAGWGVVAAANFLGRAGMAQCLQRFAQEGAWGVSPHVIPHHSLHAVSGTLSQLLKIHGPNFGVSGGPHACQEAFLAAGAVLAEGQAPGLWLLLIGHEREWVPGENSKTTEPARPPACEAVALALTPARADDGLYLHIGGDLAGAAFKDFTLSALVAALAGDRAIRAWRLPGAGWVELEVVAKDVGSRR